MNTVVFDFTRIGTIADFYKMATTALSLPDHFGNNLDALWDVLTTSVALPLTIQFTHLSMGQLEQYNDLIILLEDAAIELNDELVFEYYLNNNY